MVHPLSQQAVLVGRDAPLARLRAAFGAAGRGAHVVVIEGEAGIGKTALLDAFAAEVRAEDVLWFAGGAVDVGGAATPYGPIIEALRDIDRQRGRRTELAALVRRAAKDRVEFFDRMLATLDEVRADASRVVLVFEDLHWADDATLELLAFLARNLAPGFLLVLTHRGEESGERVWTYLAGAARPRGTRIALTRLGRDQVAALIASSGNTGVDVDDVFGRAGGNPYLTAELLAAPDGVVPTSVRDVLLARARNLDDDGWAVAEVAAVIGTRIAHEVLTAAADVADLEPAVKQLVTAGVLVADADAYAFRHALTREVLLRRLLPGDRRRRHANVARALAGRPGATSDVGLATEVATHWYLAKVPDEATPAAITAGRLCLSVFAFAEAWRQYGRALEFVAVPDVDLLGSAAEAARWAGDLDAAIDLAGRALLVADDPPTRAGLHERLGQYYWDAGRTDDARAAFRAASDLADARLFAPVNASLAHLLLMAGEVAAAADLAERAVLAAEQVGDPDAEGRARVTLGVSRCFLGDLDVGVAEVRRGQALVTKWSDLDARRRADSNLAYVVLMAGQTADACAISLASLAFLRRHGLDAASGAALTSNTIVLLRLTGRWDEADQLAGEALASDIPSGQARYVHLARAELATARGDLALARSELAAARALSDEQAHQALAVDLGLAEAEIALAADDLPAADAAVRALMAALPDSAAQRVRLQVCELGARVQAARRAAEGASDAATYETLLARIGEPTTPENRAVHTSALAELARARGEEDADLWVAAVSAWDDLGHPREAAYARLRRAATLLARPGRARAAAKPLRAAYRTAVELGAAPLAGQARALARQGRLRLDEPEVASPSLPGRDFGLTPRERDVLRGVVDGDTNREIAQRLFLSPRTVGVHVSNLLAKLGVSSRAQAAGLATRLGLLAEPTGVEKGP